MLSNPGYGKTTLAASIVQKVFEGLDLESFIGYGFREWLRFL